MRPNFVLSLGLSPKLISTKQSQSWNCNAFR